MTDPAPGRLICPDTSAFVVIIPKRKSTKSERAIPGQMPAPAVPEALAKGVVDGICIPWEVTSC